MDTTRLLTHDDVADLLSVSAQQLSEMVEAGTIPHVVLPSGDLRFFRARIEEWLAARASSARPERQLRLTFGAGNHRSSRAALSATEPRAGTRQHEILRLVRAACSIGLTRPEIETALGLCSGSVCGAVNALLRRGLVVETGADRLSPRGCRAAVLVATAPEAAP